MWNTFWMFMLSILTHIFIDVFEIDLVFYIFRSRNINKYIDNFYFLLFLEYSYDIYSQTCKSFKNLQKIPKIHAKVILYGKNSLSRHELNDFNQIFETQKKNGHIVHCIEDYFNHLLYYFIHFFALMYLFMTFYLIPLFLIITRID